MAPGPVRWPWIASSVPSETFPAGVRFRGWMSEAEGFLCSRLPASLTWPARPDLRRLPSLDRHRLCPGHGPPAAPLARRGPSCRPTGIPDLLHPGNQPFRSCLRRPTPLTSRTVKGPSPGRSARPKYPSHDARPARSTRPTDAQPARSTPSHGRSARPMHPVPGHPAGPMRPVSQTPSRPASAVSRTHGPADVPGVPAAPIWAARGASSSAAVGQVRGSVSMVFRVCCRIVTC
jgi:hypothetical protein